MRRILVALVAALAVLALPVAQAGAKSGSHGAFFAPAELTVVHGVPGLSVDVYANRTKVLDDFTFGTVSPTLKVRPGFYRLAVTPGDSTTPILRAYALAFPGRSYSAVAYLEQGGAPNLKVFRNDTSPIARGAGRVIVRHTADAPTVDVLAGGSPLISGLSNGEQAKAVVPAGTYPVAIAPAGSTSPVFGPVDLPVPAGKVTIAYALGSLTGGSFTVAVQSADARRGWWFWR